MNNKKYSPHPPENKMEMFREWNEMFKEIERLKMDKEDMYQLATRANFYELDWKEFERISNKNLM